MNKFRKFLLIQFRTAKRVLGLGGHRCVFWGMPIIAIFCLLFSFYQNEEYLFTKLPPAYRFHWWQNVPELWFGIMCLFGVASVIYLYFVFVHFHLFPMTIEEWLQLKEEGYYSDEDKKIH